jgi:hypothetical protein
MVTLKAAESTYQRAEAHRKTCQRRTAEFVALDHELSTAMVDTLRRGGDPEAVREGFSSRLSERATAVVEGNAAVAPSTDAARAAVCSLCDETYR